MPIDFHSPAASEVLAAVSTLHVVLAMLRRYRSWPRSFSLFALPGFAFAAAPWAFPQPVGLAAFVVGHLLWFATCERAFPHPDPVPPGWTETKVLRVYDQTADIRTFRMRRPT